MILKRSDIYSIVEPVPEPSELQQDELLKKLKQQEEKMKKMKFELVLKNQKIKFLEKSVNKTKIHNQIKYNLKNNNEFYFERVYKVLNIILNYHNVKDYSLYGSFIENLLSKKNLENTTLNIFLKDLENFNELYNSYGLLEILYQSNFIQNTKEFDEICYYSSGQDNIPFYNLLIDLIPGSEEKKVVVIRLHTYNYLRKITCSSRNIEINQWGINNIFNLDRNLMHSNISGLNILKTLQKTMQSETILYNPKDVNKNLIENYEELFELLSTQNEYINKKWTIQGNGFRCIIDECSVCLEKTKIFELECHHSFCINCLHQHINHQSIHNKKCPLCRREMILQ
jgi:hypothetical protein